MLHKYKNTKDFCMGNANSFKEAVKKIQSSIDMLSQEDYLSDTKKRCMVHTTDYLPLRHDDGTLYIPSTAMATNFEIPRTTVHTTFNHIVSANSGGDWGDKPYIILAPYDDVVSKNGDPAAIDATDTYWSVSPERGLVLPNTAYIIKPSNDTLFNISEHGATYKFDNYTEEEIETILGMISPKQRKEYEELLQGYDKVIMGGGYDDVSFLNNDARIKKAYDLAKDKQAFLRGLFEEKRIGILSTYLRNSVTRLSMEKLGYSYITFSNCYSSGEHSSSFYKIIEHVWDKIHDISEKKGLESLLLEFEESPKNYEEIIQSIATNKPIDIEKIYERYFVSGANYRLDILNDDIVQAKQKIEFYSNHAKVSEAEKIQAIKNYSHAIYNFEKEKKRLSAVKKIADYDKNLAAVVKKNSEILSKQFNVFREQIKNRPEYDKFLSKLKSLYETKIQKKPETPTMDIGKDY